MITDELILPLLGPLGVWLRRAAATAAGAANRLADRLESAGLKPEPKAPPPPPPPAARGGWKGVVVPTALSKRFAFAR